MAKEKSTVELKDEKQQLITRSKAITEAAKGEKRMLNDTENTELGSIQCRLADINIELSELAETNKGKGTPYGTQKRFSLLRAIGESISGTYSDESLAVIERGRAQMSGMETVGSLLLPVEDRAAVVAGTPANGGNVIDTDLLDIMTPLSANLILAQVGANIVTGLTNNVSIPKYTGTTANWAGETASAEDGTGTFSKQGFTPKRLTAVTYISKQMLAQDSLGVERMLRDQIVRAIAAKLESTIFGAATTSTLKPDGFFTTVPAAGGVVDWKKIVELETKINSSNALQGNLAYVIHPSILGKLKTTVKDASGAGGFLIGDNGLLNGFKCLVTTNVASGLQTAKDEYGAIFANWADYFIGQWGALDLTVDPYTMAGEGQIKLIVNAYFDAGIRREESFAKTTWK
ncbi:phage major capsid protein [Bacteroides neonati]|uniref:phage major capsid protein n=1 Tax=Bacteroides neonati TaxID=1347393 RepID=UPI0004BBB559|nr:phage major capsid protein [Bacteroides neonati]